MQTVIEFVIGNWHVIAGVWLGVLLILATTLCGHFNGLKAMHHEDQGTNWRNVDAAE